MDNEILNYYQILGIEDINTPVNKIKEKYHMLLKKFRPDKNPNADPQTIELINKAWTILGNDIKRRKYDLKIKNQKSKNLSDTHWKNDFDTFIKGNTINNICSLENFKSEFNTMDENNSFNRSNYDKEIKNKTNNINNIEEREIDDLVYQRQNEEIEFSQEKIFNEQLDLNLFNAAFESYKKIDDNRIIKKDNEFTAYNFNSHNINGINSTMFNNSIGTDNYSTINFDRTVDTCKLKLNNLQQETQTFNHNHNANKDVFAAEIEKKVLEYETETNSYKELQYEKLMDYKLHSLVTQEMLENEDLNALMND
jgi:curved DNA-binding protein CbpA